MRVLRLVILSTLLACALPGASAIWTITYHYVAGNSVGTPAGDVGFCESVVLTSVGGACHMNALWNRYSVSVVDDEQGPWPFHWSGWAEGVPYEIGPVEFTLSTEECGTHGRGDGSVIVVVREDCDWFTIFAGAGSMSGTVTISPID